MNPICRAVKVLWEDETGTPTGEYLMWLIVASLSCAPLILGLVWAYKNRVDDYVNPFMQEAEAERWNDGK